MEIISTANDDEARKRTKSTENVSGLSQNFNNDERILIESEFYSKINEHAYNTNDTISLAYINVCGLKSKCSASEFEETVNLCDFIGVGETKLDRFDTVDIDGFQFYSCVRQHTTNKSDGFGIFIKKCYTKYVALVH